MKHYRHPNSLTCPVTDQHTIFVKRVLRYADKLKSSRVSVRKRCGKQSKNAEVHAAKLNTLQAVLAIFDRTIIDIERVKSVIAEEV